jgi:hypothetical protein
MLLSDQCNHMLFTGNFRFKMAVNMADLMDQIQNMANKISHLELQERSHDATLESANQEIASLKQELEKVKKCEQDKDDQVEDQQVTYIKNLEDYKNKNQDTLERFESIICKLSEVQEKFLEDKFSDFLKVHGDLRKSITDLEESVTSNRPLKDQVSKLSDLHQSLQETVTTLQESSSSTNDACQQPLQKSRKSSHGILDISNNSDSVPFHESDEKAQNVLLKHSLILNTDGIQKKVPLKKQVLQKLNAIVSLEERNQLSAAISYVSFLRKKVKDEKSLFIKLRTGTKPKVLAILKKHKTALTESQLHFKSNTCLITRTKKCVLGCIAAALNKVQGPKTACLPRHSLTACLMYMKNEDTKPTRLNYKTCIEQFSKHIDEATKNYAKIRLNANFLGPKAAAILLF